MTDSEMADIWQAYRYAMDALYETPPFAPNWEKRLEEVKRAREAFETARKSVGLTSMEDAMSKPKRSDYA